jgi:hypothetical protein
MMVTVARYLALGLTLLAAAQACGGRSARSRGGSGDAGEAGDPASGATSGAAGSGGTEATGGSGNSTGGAPGGVEIPPELRAELEEFCAWWGQTTCELVAERTPLRVDADHCVEVEARACAGNFISRMAPSFAEGRLVYHPEVREAVARDLRDMPLSTFSEREAMPSFRALFQGTVENGEPCQQADGYGFYVNECADGYCEWGACPGTCRPFPGPDDACDWNELRCAPSAFCDGGCVERPGEGEACDPEADTCLAPAVCLGLVGECGRRVDLGEACYRTADCRDGACRGGVCELVGPDEACEDDSECAPELSCLGGACLLRGTPIMSFAKCGSDRDCLEDQVCVQYDQGSGCADALELGSPCTECNFWCVGCPSGLVCLGATETTDGRCAPPRSLGDSCSSATCFGELTCVNGTCMTTAPPSICDPTP